MKKILIPVAIIAAIGVTAPKIIAIKAEKQLQDVVNTLNDVDGYNAVIKEHNQGWFGSTSIVNIELDFSQFAPQPAGAQQTPPPFENIDIDIIADVQYGPILTDADSLFGQLSWDIHIPLEHSSLSYADISQTSIYRSRGHLGLFGDVSLKDEFPAFVISQPEKGLSFEFDGYQGRGETVNNQLDYSGDVPSFSMQGNGIALKTEGWRLNWEGDVNYLAALQGIYTDSDLEFKIENIEVNDGQLATVKEFGVFANTDVDESELLDMRMGYTVGQIVTPFDQFTDIEITMTLNNLSSAFINDYQQVIKNASALSDPDEIKRHMTEPLIEALQHKPSFTVNNIGFSHSSGRLQSTGEVSLSTTEFNIDNVFDKNYWRQSLLVTSSISLPITLFNDLGQKYVQTQLQNNPSASSLTTEELRELSVNQTNSMMNGFIQQGLLTQEDDQLNLEFSIQDGQGTLNGNPFPVDGLFASN